MRPHVSILQEVIRELHGGLPREQPGCVDAERTFVIEAHQIH